MPRPITNAERDAWRKKVRNSDPYKELLREKVLEEVGAGPVTSAIFTTDTVDYMAFLTEEAPTSVPALKDSTCMTGTTTADCVPRGPFTDSRTFAITTNTDCQTTGSFPTFNQDMWAAYVTGSPIHPAPSWSEITRTTPPTREEERTSPMRRLYEVFVVDVEASDLDRVTIYHEIAASPEMAKIKAILRHSEHHDADVDDLDLLVREIGPVRNTRPKKEEGAK